MSLGYCCGLILPSAVHYTEMLDAVGLNISRVAVPVQQKFVLHSYEGRYIQPEWGRIEYGNGIVRNCEC